MDQKGKTSNNSDCSREPVVVAPPTEVSLCCQ